MVQWQVIDVIRDIDKIEIPIAIPITGKEQMVARRTQERVSVDSLNMKTATMLTENVRRTAKYPICIWLPIQHRG